MGNKADAVNLLPTKRSGGWNDGFRLAAFALVLLIMVNTEALSVFVCSHALALIMGEAGVLNVRSERMG